MNFEYNIYYLKAKMVDKQKNPMHYLLARKLVNNKVVLMNLITSKYLTKSDYIKLQYYPIQDWQEAGLKMPSYIDILSKQYVDYNDELKQRLKGKLTINDMVNLTNFITTYPKRKKAWRQKNNTTK